MRIAACARVLDDAEIQLIHQAMLRIVSEVGMNIQSDVILDKLQELGGRVDRRTMVARVAPDLVEQFIADSDKVDWDHVEPRVVGHAHASLGYYLDPVTDEHTSWSEDRLATWAKVARHLEDVSTANLLGCPIEGVPNEIHPLHQRYLCWKHGLVAGGSIWDIRLCPYILDMCAAMARAYDKMTRDYFTGAVYLTTTLTLAAGEAEHFVYFAERGFRVGIGHMTSAGGSAPVTLAGAVALHLAETVFINIIRRAFYGGREFPIGCTVAPLDMRTLIYPYGRPERQLANAMMADMAKQYGTAFHAHAGHAEAKRPSAEAGAQRALTSIPTLMCGGRTQVAAGLLSTDQVFSPIQMIIDNEFIGALKRFSRGCVVSEDTLAVDVIREVGPGNLFIDHQHTVDHFRTEHWEPDLWSREMFDAWMAQGARTDVDKARERYHEIVALPDQPFGFSEETDRELRGIMEKAERDLR